MVTVKVFGALGSVVGESEIVLDLTGGTLEHLIDVLAARYGEKVKEELLDEQGKFDYAYIILVRGKTLSSLSDKIEDGAEVVIASMMAGG